MQHLNVRVGCADLSVKKTSATQHVPVVATACSTPRILSLIRTPQLPVQVEVYRRMYEEKVGKAKLTPFSATLRPTTVRV